jgi:hypothetical protein
MKELIYRCHYFNKCNLKLLLIDRSCCFKLRPDCFEYIRRKDEEGHFASELEEIASELRGAIIESSPVYTLDEIYFELIDKLDWNYWDLTDLEDELLGALKEMKKEGSPRELASKLEEIAKKVRVSNI